MVKIKQTKQLNLPQLIEWGWNNPSSSRRKRFYSKDEKIGIIKHLVHFNEFGYAEIENRYCLEPADTFTVEVEEEITEDTPLSMIIECDEDSSFWVFKEITLKEMHESKCLKETTKYYKDEDEKMYLIWRNGKLVE